MCVCVYIYQNTLKKNSFATFRSVCHWRPAIFTLPTNHKFTFPLWLSLLSLHYIEDAAEMLRLHSFPITHRIFLLFVIFPLEIRGNVLCHKSPYFPHYFFNSLPQLAWHTPDPAQRKKIAKCLQRKHTGWLLQTRDKCCTVKYFIYDIS